MSTKKTNPKDAVGVNKVPVSTVSFSALAHAARAVQALYASDVFSPLKPVYANKAYDRVLSCLAFWWEGQDRDAATHLPNLAVALGTLFVLRNAMVYSEEGGRLPDGQSPFVDDRIAQAPSKDSMLNATVREITQRYAGNPVRHFTIEDTRDAHATSNTLVLEAFEAINRQQHALAAKEASGKAVEWSDLGTEVPWSVLPAYVTKEVGGAMLEGALKYGRHNYRDAGVRASVYFDATMRHMTAWLSGEDIDPDSGFSHVTKGISSLTVLIDALVQGLVTDDRPPRCASFLTAPAQAV